MKGEHCEHNSSSTPQHSSPVSLDSGHLAPAVVLCFCFVLGVPGNIAVIILKPNWQHLSSLSQCLMLNLTISDLLCLLTLPLWIYTLLYSWILGLVTCKILAYVVYCSIYGSLLTVTALSVQRCLQVVYLQQYLDQVGKRRMLILLWLVAMIMSSPALVVRQLTKDECRTTSCKPQYSSQVQWMAVLLTECLMGFSSFSVVALTFVNSCLNPILYAFTSRNMCIMCVCQNSEHKCCC